MYSRPTTDTQKTYYSRHGGKMAKYATFRAFSRVAWAIIATVGLRTVLLNTLSVLPQIEIVSWIAAALIVLAGHSLLEETLKTYFFDRFDDKDGDGNPRDEADSSPLLPILILVGLVLADFLGARTYLYSNIAPAALANRSEIDSLREVARAEEKQFFVDAKAEIEQRFSAQHNSAAAQFDRQIATWQGKTVISDNDRAWITKNVRSLQVQKAATLAKILEKKAAELAEARRNYDTELGNVDRAHQMNLQRADLNDTNEMSRLLDEKSDAHTNSWMLSLFLAIIFVSTMYAQVRISAKSGILPHREYTTLHAHGGFWEKLFRHVIVDVWDRASHNFLVKIHSKLAVRNLADFDGHLIEIDHAAREVRGLPTVAVDNPLPSEVMRLRLEIGDLWTAVCEYGEANDEIAVWEKRRELLEDHGWVSAPKTDGSVTFYPKRMSFGEMDKLHPLPRIRAFAPHPTRAAAEVASPAAAAQPVIELAGNRTETVWDNGGQGNALAVVADMDKWMKRARQCHRRTHPRNHEARSEEARAANTQRRDAYLECLRLVGCNIGDLMTGETVADNDIDIRRPRPEVAAQMATQNQTRLAQLLRFLGEVKEEI